MRKSIMAMIITLGIISFGSSISAAVNIEVADSTIKAAMEADYQLHFADALQSKKADFHSDDTHSSFKTAQFGEGVAFYRIADTADMNKTDTFSAYLAGYKFPLYLNGKPVGVIDAAQVNGQWAITNISNMTDLESKLNQAKTNQKGNSQIKYIDDRSYDIQSVYMKDSDGERVIDLRNNKSSTIKEFNNSIAAVKNKYAEAKKNNQAEGKLLSTGGINDVVQHNQSIIPYVFLSMGLLFLIPVLYILLQMRNSKKVAS